MSYPNYDSLWVPLDYRICGADSMKTKSGRTNPRRDGDIATVVVPILNAGSRGRICFDDDDEKSWPAICTKAALEAIRRLECEAKVRVVKGFRDGYIIEPIG